MGSVRLHPFATDTIIIDSDKQLPKQAVIHLSKHLNMDTGLLVKNDRDVAELIQGKDS